MEPRHVTDLRDEDRGEGGSDPGDLLDGPVAGVVSQLVGDVALEDGGGVRSAV